MHPAVDDSFIAADYGDTVRCDVEGFGAVVLEISKTDAGAATPRRQGQAIRAMEREH